MADDHDRVERSIELRAPRSRVWRAISNAKDFGTWFGMGEPLELQGDFVPGARIVMAGKLGGAPVSGLFCVIEKVEPETYLAFRWVPYEIPDGEDPAKHVRVRAMLDSDVVVVEVEDEGAGFDLDAFEPDPTTADQLEREDGRGLFLMRRLMDRVERVRGSTHGTVVRLTLRRP